MGDKANGTKYQYFTGPGIDAETCFCIGLRAFVGMLYQYSNTRQLIALAIVHSSCYFYFG